MHCSSPKSESAALSWKHQDPTGIQDSETTADSGQSAVTDIDPGIGGALIGGWFFNAFAMAGVTGFNLYSRSVGVAVVALLRILYPANCRRS